MDTHKSIIRGDGDVSLDASVNAEHYDALAEDYDAQLRQWGYEAPEVGARLLADNLEGFAGAHILDCGCGTGMTGEALRAAGAEGTIDGVDASEASLAVARKKGVYDSLAPADLNRPLALGDSSVDGVLCVGVLSYVREEPLFREWMRVVCPGGVVVFTCRDDFFDQRGYPATLERLEQEGGWQRIEVTGPMPYLADHEDFADKIRVIYGVFRVA